MDIATPTARVSNWHTRFSKALEKGDVEGALDLFAQLTSARAETERR